MLCGTPLLSPFGIMSDSDEFGNCSIFVDPKISRCAIFFFSDIRRQQRSFPIMAEERAGIYVEKMVR